jgi:uncharacterized membrane protein YiaA
MIIGGGLAAGGAIISQMKAAETFGCLMLIVGVPVFLLGLCLYV